MILSEFPEQAVFFGIAEQDGVDKEIGPVGRELSLQFQYGSV